MGDVGHSDPQTAFSSEEPTNSRGKIVDVRKRKHFSLYSCAGGQTRGAWCFISQTGSPIGAQGLQITLEDPNVTPL
jgi:hypothetical protein